MRTVRTKTALVKVLIPIAYMSPGLYIQEASLGPEGRVYISKGVAGGRSISIHNVRIIACGVMFIED